MVLPTRRGFLRRSAVGLAAISSATTIARAANPAPPKIRVGQIGVAHAHAGKLEVYRRSPDYEVVGIVEPDAQRRAAAEKTPAFRDLPWMTREQLLGVDGLEAVLVETSVRNLLENAEICVSAGKHVHLDKPAGESFSQYKRLLAAAADGRLLVQMGYMFRYNPAVVLLQKFLREGWLGEIFEAHAVMSKIVPLEDRKALAEYPGGIMFELGCHLIDVLVAVLGKPDHVQSFARHSAPIADGLLDNMLAVCEYPRAIASIKSSAQEVDGGARRHFVVCGTLGTFRIEPLESPVVRYTLDRDRGEYPRKAADVKLGPYARYVGDAVDMAKILRGEKASDFPYSHDLAVQETVLRASGLDLAG